MYKINVPLIVFTVIVFAVVVGCFAGEKGNNTQKTSSTTAAVAPKKEESSSPLVTMYELGSKKCIPCKAMQKVMDSLEVRYPKDLDIVFHDVWTPEGKIHGKEFGIRSIPTQVFHDINGKEIFRHEGFFSLEEIVALLKKSGVSK